MEGGENEVTLPAEAGAPGRHAKTPKYDMQGTIKAAHDQGRPERFDP